MNLTVNFDKPDIAEHQNRVKKMLREIPTTESF